MPRSADTRSESWWIPRPPLSYGILDDSRLVRHVRVPSGATLHQIKSKILQAYEDQYKPEQVTLFTRMDEEDPLRITTDGAARRKILTYGSEHASNKAGDSRADGTTLLIVSAMNNEENKLLVLPAVHSPPIATILTHLDAGAIACDDEDTMIPNRLLAAASRHGAWRIAGGMTPGPGAAA